MKGWCLGGGEGGERGCLCLLVVEVLKMGDARASPGVPMRKVLVGRERECRGEGKTAAVRGREGPNPVRFRDGPSVGYSFRFHTGRGSGVGRQRRGSCKWRLSRPTVPGGLRLETPLLSTEVFIIPITCYG